MRWYGTIVGSQFVARQKTALLIRGIKECTIFCFKARSKNHAHFKSYNISKRYEKRIRQQLDLS